MGVGVRNIWIDLLRGISIILVLLHHFNLKYPLQDTALSQVFGWQAVHAIVRNGNYGVTMFFVISGFLITSNAQNRWGSLSCIDINMFYKLRIARILPCLLLLLTVVNVLAATGLTVFQNHPDDGPPVSFWLVNFASLTFWMNILMTTRAGWVNYALCVLWSLSVEEVFYLSFPIACLVLKRQAVLAGFWALFIVLGPIWRGLHPDDEAQFLYAYFASFDGIAIGCCTALLAQRLELRGKWVILAVVLISFAMLCLYFVDAIGNTKVYGVTLMALGTGFLLVIAYRRPQGILSDRTRVIAVLAWFGRLSYELYLFHLVVLGLIRSAFPEEALTGDRKLILLIVYFASASGSAALIGRLYSEPLNHIIRSTLRVRRAATAL